MICFQSEISILVLHSTAASLAGLAAASTNRGGIRGVERARAVRASIRQVGAVPRVGVWRNIRTALVGLLGHLEDLAKLHALVGLHRLLNVREPLICHFVY